MLVFDIEIMYYFIWSDEVKMYKINVKLLHNKLNHKVGNMLWMSPYPSLIYIIVKLFIDFGMFQKIKSAVNIILF